MCKEKYEASVITYIAAKKNEERNSVAYEEAMKAVVAATQARVEMENKLNNQ